MQVCRLAKISALPVRPLSSWVPLRGLSSLSFISRLFGISASEPKPKRVPNHQTVHGVELQDNFSWLKNRGSKVRVSSNLFAALDSRGLPVKRAQNRLYPSRIPPLFFASSRHPAQQKISIPIPPDCTHRHSPHHLHFPTILN